ncbi:MAG: hypothetical protein PHR52_10975 [Fermentimonas sp.]|nr:hypothetical protein [Fermentimonas sp.]
MRNDIIHITLSIILIGIGFSGCRTSKSIQRDKTIQTGSYTIDRRTEALRVTDEVYEGTKREGSETEQSYTKITEYDTTGSVQRVSETWRDRRLSNLVTEERDARTFSVSNSEQQISIKDSADIRVSETSHTTTDSRPVQGVEWIWVILSVVLISSVILYIIYNRIK